MSVLSPPPIRSPIYLPSGAMAPVWVQWWQRLYQNLGGNEGILPVVRGGTGIGAGTSGGVLGFIAVDQIASSALLTQNRIVLGGGAGATPSTPLALGTTTQVLHGNAAGAPTWGQVSLTADVTGTLPVGNGGTGLATYTIGDLVYASAANVLSKLADVATGNALISGGIGAAPSWGKVTLTAHVSGVLPEANGGTNQSTYTLGDTLFASAANTISKLSGNTAATRKFLRQTGSGAASAAPTWDTILAADVPGSALTKTDDTNVTLTLGGAPATSLLNAASLTLGWTGTLSVTRGGTGANLSATGGASNVLKQTSVGGAVTVAQLAAADLSNGTTGSAGGVVLATSPTLTTPVIGAATGTSLFVTSGVSSSMTTGSAVVANVGKNTTFTITNSKTMTVNVSGPILFQLYVDGTGVSTLFSTTWAGTVITAVSPLSTGLALTSTPAAGELGIFKSANTGVFSIKSGSGAAAALGPLSIVVLGGTVSAVTDWT